MEQDRIERYWQENKDVLAKIKQNAKSYFKGISNLADAFKLTDRSLRCMDEGTTGGIHLAGSGILLDMATVSKYLIQAKIDGVYSHAECGAAALYAKNENLDGQFADEYGIEWAKTLAERLHLPYKGHTTIDKMKRPSGLHIARVAYYDGIGSFDYARVNALPPGFIISRKYLDKEYAQKELGIAISIALGHHGFGSRIDRDHPFLVIVLAAKGEKPDRFDQLSAEASEIARQHQSKVRVVAVEVDL